MLLYVIKKCRMAKIAYSKAILSVLCTGILMNIRYYEKT